jgi:succinate dehydrogenase hydrophobic anchor subunit
MFCATMMNIFEGNQQILNFYSETDKPKSFFKLMVTLFLVITVFIGISVGVLGYMAFGNST